jgi:hypothetical protein
LGRLLTTGALFSKAGGWLEGLAGDAAIDLASESARFGRVIGWGEGQLPAAVEQTISVTQNLTKSQVESWAGQGLTKSWVEKQLASYTKALEAGGDKLKNVQLLPRKQLMEKILSLWD